MRDKLNGKTILVTGGTGSIGSQIVTQLLNYDMKKVIIFSRDEIKHFLIKKRVEDERLETFVGDVREYRSIERVFEKFDVDLIYHAAAMKHVVMCEKFPLECAKTNIIGTQNVVDLAVKHRVPKMITISTDKAVNPLNVMGATKLIAERITLNAHYSCVRFGNVANSRGSVIPVFIDNLLNKKSLTITDPHVTRFIMKMFEAINLVITSTEYAKGDDIFILKMKAFKLGDLVDVFLNTIAPILNISKNEVKVNTIGLLPGEKLHEELISEMELDQIYGLDDLYLLLRNSRDVSNYQHIKKINLQTYTSKDVEFLSKKEIKEIVVDYLKEMKGGNFDHI